MKPQYWLVLILAIFYFGLALAEFHEGTERPEGDPFREFDPFGGERGFDSRPRGFDEGFGPGPGGFGGFNEGPDDFGGFGFGPEGNEGFGSGGFSQFEGDFLPPRMPNKMSGARMFKGRIQGMIFSELDPEELFVFYPDSDKAAEYVFAAIKEELNFCDRLSEISEGCEKGKEFCARIKGEINERMEEERQIAEEDEDQIRIQIMQELSCDNEPNVDKMVELALSAITQQNEEEHNERMQEECQYRWEDFNERACQERPWEQQQGFPFQQDYGQQQNYFPQPPQDYNPPEQQSGDYVPPSDYTPPTDYTPPPEGDYHPPDEGGGEYTPPPEPPPFEPPPEPPPSEPPPEPPPETGGVILISPLEAIFGIRNSGISFQEGPPCEQEAFIQHCINESKERFERFNDSERMKRMMERQMKRMAREFSRHCKQAELGEKRCEETVARSCTIMQEQLDFCRENASEEKTKQLIKEVIARLFKWRALQEERDVDDRFMDAVGEIPSTGDSELDQVAAAVSNELTDAVINVDELEKEEKKKDFIYRIGQIFGFQKEKEKNDARKFKTETERVSSSIEALSLVAEQVENETAKAKILAIILELEEQREELERKATSKEQGASGIFSIFGN